MKFVLFALLSASSIAFAETATLTVEGMHCSACKKMVSDKVCNNEAIKKTSESCEVKLTDSKKQLGEIKIVSKKGSTVNMAEVVSSVQAAGTEYKVIKKDTK